MLMWIYYRFIVALIVNIILGIFLVMFVQNGREIYGKLYVDESTAVTGKFKSFKDNIVDIDGGNGKGNNRKY